MAGAAAEPDVVEQLRASRSRRSGAPTPASACGSSTFSNAVSIGSRKNRWKTKPISRSRRRLRSASGSDPTSRPWNRTSPLVGTSTQPRTCSSVDLPQPDGPTTPRYSPSANARSTRRSARRPARPPSGTPATRSTRLDDRASRHHLAAQRRGDRQRRDDAHRIGGGGQRGDRKEARRAERARAARTTKKCRSAGTPGIARRMASSHSDSAAPSGTARTTAGEHQDHGLDQHAGHDPPAGQPERPQRGNLAEPLVDGDGQQHGDQEEAEEQRDRREHDRDLPEVGELDAAETLDELLVRDDVQIEEARRGWRPPLRPRQRPPAIAPAASPTGRRSSSPHSLAMSSRLVAAVRAPASSNGKSTMPEITNVAGGSALPLSPQRSCRTTAGCEMSRTGQTAIDHDRGGRSRNARQVLYLRPASTSDGQLGSTPMNRSCRSDPGDRFAAADRSGGGAAAGRLSSTRTASRKRSCSTASTSGSLAMVRVDARSRSESAARRRVARRWPEPGCRSRRGRADRGNDSTSPRDRSSMSNRSAPTAATPRTASAVRAGCRMIVSHDRRSMFRGASIQRRMSVSNCCRRSVHDAMRLARMPSGIAMATDCNATRGVIRRKTSAVS